LIPSAVGDTASEGGAWSMAILAEYLRTGGAREAFKRRPRGVFAGAKLDVSAPDPADAAGYAKWLEQCSGGGLAIEKAATGRSAPRRLSEKSRILWRALDESDSACP